jgi:mannose-1-phosphate guanylyltransferase
MFAFNTFFMAEQFYQYAPEVIKCFGKLKPPKPSELTTSRGVKILNTQGAAWSGLENAYKNAQSISFDYAIAEKCKKTAMVRTNFEWIDIGNWEEYAKIRGKSSSLVFNLPEESSCFVDSDIPVALAGVEDLIVVIRSGKNGEPATALITKKGQTQKVRDIVDLIKKSGKTSIL